MYKANKKDIAVIGAGGRFGSAVVEHLVNMKKYVFAIDNNEKSLVPISRIANQVVISDGSDIVSLKALGIDEFDTVIVGVSNNIEIVSALLEIGVKYIIAKSVSSSHSRVLKQIGVDIIIRPEYEAGIKTALIAANPAFIKYSNDIQEIGDDYAIGTTIINNPLWFKKTIQELKFIELQISIVSIKRGAKVFLPHGKFVLLKNDQITIIGKMQNITKAFEEANNFLKTTEIKIKKINKKEIKI